MKPPFSWLECEPFNYSIRHQKCKSNSCHLRAYEQCQNELCELLMPREPNWCHVLLYTSMPLEEYLKREVQCTLGRILMRIVGS